MTTATLMLALLLAPGGPGAADAVAARPLAGPTSGPRLVLVYRGVNREVDRALAPLLSAFAEEYGDDGLAVAAAPSVGLSLPGPVPGWWSPPEDSRDRPALALVAADGAERLALPGDVLDLFAVYRLCESELRGRARVGYAEHARRLLEGHLTAGTGLPGVAGGPTRTVGAVLAASDQPCLFVPPGCTGCLLAKYGAGLAGAILDDPDRGLLAYEADVAEALRREGWTGVGQLLPLDGAARILQLRQDGVYAPLLVARASVGGLIVRSLSRAREEGP